VIPVWLKLTHLLFVAFLIPIYRRQYGFANFLWFSDIALLALGPAMWLESPLLSSMMALAVLGPELLWTVDFLWQLATGRSWFGLSAYMFDREIRQFIRALSLFHLALPPLLLWLVWRLGYDRRALLWQTVLAAVVLPLSYIAGTPQQNVNWVYGLGARPQRAVPGPVFVVFLIVMFPLAIYLPTHLVLSRVFAGP
jgi:hypothetical protein